MPDPIKPPLLLSLRHRWFVSIDYTDAALVRQAYEKGHEIATHTVHHPYEPNATEIIGAKLWLNQVRATTASSAAALLAPAGCCQLCNVPIAGCPIAQTLPRKPLPRHLVPCCPNPTLPTLAAAQCMLALTTLPTPACPCLPCRPPASHWKR